MVLTTCVFYKFPNLIKITATSFLKIFLRKTEYSKKFHAFILPQALAFNLSLDLSSEMSDKNLKKNLKSYFQRT